MMRAFSSVTSVAAPLLENAIDTDVIFPARFLLLMDRDGLGQYAFKERRSNTSAPFILDTPPYDKAEILVTGETFGTGSSREQAVWAIAGLGIRVVIARSFGEIFENNCFKNGVLAITLADAAMAAVERAALAGEPVTVDLETQKVLVANGEAFAFDVDPARRTALLKGLDEVGLILELHEQDIAAFEAKRSETAPWLAIDPARLAAVAADDTV